MQQSQLKSWALRRPNVNTIGATTNNPEIKRFLGLEGQSWCLSLVSGNDWAKNIIAQVGNYGEIFERNIGVNTPLGIGRGVNALWTDGGLQYSPPFR
jgi:general L-amino acid transport system substrate-binding protein